MSLSSLSSDYRIDALLLGKQWSTYSGLGASL